MARKSDTVSIVKFDGRAITRMRARQSPDGIEVLSFDAAAYSGDTPPERALEEFVKAHPLGDDRVFTILPRQEVTTRILRLPTQDPREAANMVRLSAEEFVPYSLDEMIVDQCILDTLDTGEARTLAVLAHKDIVNRHIDILRKAGVEPEQVLLSTMCLYALSECAGPLNERYALADLAANGLEVMVVENGRLVYSRGVVANQDWSLLASDASDFAEAPPASGVSVPPPPPVETTGFHALMAEEMAAAPAARTDSAPAQDAKHAEILSELAIEVRGSLSAYRRESEDGAGVDTVYLSSDWMDPASAAPALSRELDKKILPAVFAERSMQWPQTASTLPAVSAGAAYIAFEKAPRRITLLPESLLALRRLEGVKRHMLRAAIFLLAAIAGLGLLHYQRIHAREKMIAELEGKIAIIGPKARGVAAKQNQLNILRNQVEQDGSFLEALSTVTKAAPEHNINVTSLSYDRKEGVNIWGRSRSVDTIHAFAQGLRSMAAGQFKYFANARSLYEQQGDERGVAIFYYQIAVPTKGDEEKNAPTRATTVH